MSTPLQRMSEMGRGGSSFSGLERFPEVFCFLSISHLAVSSFFMPLTSSGCIDHFLNLTVPYFPVYKIRVINKLISHSHLSGSNELTYIRRLSQHSVIFAIIIIVSSPQIKYFLLVLISDLVYSRKFLKKKKKISLAHFISLIFNLIVDCINVDTFLKRSLSFQIKATPL